MNLVTTIDFSAILIIMCDNIIIIIVLLNVAIDSDYTTVLFMF